MLFTRIIIFLVCSTGVLASSSQVDHDLQKDAGEVRKQLRKSESIKGHFLKWSSRGGSAFVLCFAEIKGLIFKEETGTKYAVKIQRHDKDGTGELFQNEIGMMTEMSHDPNPHVASLCFTVEVNGRKALVLEWCDQDFQHYFDTCKVFETKDLLLFLNGVSRGLSYLHGKGIVHNDLKPANLLVPAGNGLSGIKIADFGLSSTIGSIPDGVHGTVRYIPQEVLDKVPSNPKSDLWSLGIIVFALAGLGNDFPAADAELYAPSFRERLALLQKSLDFWEGQSLEKIFAAAKFEWAIPILTHLLTRVDVRWDDAQLLAYLLEQNAN